MWHAGDVVLRLWIKENSREKAIFFQTLVSRAVMMIRPATSHIGYKNILLPTYSSHHRDTTPWPVLQEARVCHMSNCGWQNGATTSESACTYCCLRWHATWRDSVTRLLMIWPNQTSWVSTTCCVWRVPNLRKVRTENLKSRTDLQDQVMDGWSVTHWKQNTA